MNAKRLVLLLLAGWICTPSSARALGDADLVTILRLEDQRAPVRHLLPYLIADDADTRARACVAAGRIAGPAPDARDREARMAHGALLGRLREDPQAAVRAAAAWSLGLLQTDAAGASLAALLIGGRESDPRVREAAAEGLGRCGPDPHPAAMAIALSDDDPRVTGAALLAVWRGSRPVHISRILELSEHPDPEIRWRATYALMRALGARASGRTPIPEGAALGDEDRCRIVQRLLPMTADPDVRVRLQALRALGSAPEIDEAEEALSDVLEDPDPRIRVEAVRSLGRLLETEGACLPAAVAISDRHPHVRIEAIRALGRCVPLPALLEQLASAFRSHSPWERGVALETAGEKARSEGLIQQALHAVQRSRRDPDWSVRFAGAALLAGLWNDEESREDAAVMRRLLRECFEDDPRVAKAVVTTWLPALDEQERWAGVERLLGMEDDDVMRLLAIESLSEVLATPDSSDVAARAWPRMVSVATRAAGDPSSDVRGAVVRLLAALTDTQSRDSALRLLRQIAAAESDPGVRRAAWATLPGESDLDPGHAPRDYARALAVACEAREVILETAKGTLRIELFGEDAPLTVASFVTLAETGFYDGGAWHRVVPDFVVQDGCPRGDGWGGPDQRIRCEVSPRHYWTGTMGMAHAGKDTGGSQFFLTLSDQPHLDGRYTIFGRLLEGWDVMQAIAQGDPIRRIQVVRR